jgi:hypothetical protein
MTTKTTQHEFLLAAHELSTVAPGSWERFVKTFSAITQERCIQAVQAPMDSAHVARGHAQALLSLADTFTDLEARVRVIQNMKSKTNRP